MLAGGEVDRAEGPAGLVGLEPVLRGDVLYAVVALACVAHEGGSTVASAAARNRSRASPTFL
jgi:hypothetical protein